MNITVIYVPPVYFRHFIRTLKKGFTVTFKVKNSGIKVIEDKIYAEQSFEWSHCL